MKRIAYICVILLCSISFAFAQGAKPGRTNTNSKKVVKKTVVSPFAEAEKAWILFWNKLQQAVKNRNSETLTKLTSNNSEVGDLDNSTLKLFSDIIKSGRVMTHKFDREITKSISGTNSIWGCYIVFAYENGKWYFSRYACDSEE